MVFFGKRRDGNLVKTDGFTRFLYFITKKRSNSEVYLNREIDVTELVSFYEEKKKNNEDLTYFHLFSTAIAKMIYNLPLFNRFVIGGNYYDRNEVTLSFVAKVKFSDESKELLNVIKVLNDDNLDTISNKIKEDVNKIRSNKGSDTDNFASLLGKFPKWLMAIFVWFIKRLDNHDMLPKSLTSGSIYHSSVLLSNLGSIHCGGIYHHLTDFGTNSVIVTIGEIKKVPRVIDDKVVIRYVCEFGITLDERIADGVYFAKGLNMLEYVFNNPVLLEENMDRKIDIKNINIRK